MKPPKKYDPVIKVQKILDQIDQNYFSLKEESISLKPINSEINKNLIQKTEVQKTNNLPSEKITKKLEPIPEPKSGQIIVSKENLDLKVDEKITEKRQNQITDKLLKKAKTKRKKSNIWEKFL